MVEDECLLPVGPHTLPEGFFARKSVIECGDAAFMGDDTASNTLDPVKLYMMSMHNDNYTYLQ